MRKFNGGGGASLPMWNTRDPGGNLLSRFLRMRLTTATLFLFTIVLVCSFLRFFVIFHRISIAILLLNTYDYIEIFACLVSIYLLRRVLVSDFYEIPLRRTGIVIFVYGGYYGTHGDFKEGKAFHCVQCTAGSSAFIARTATHPPFLIRTFDPRDDIWVSRHIHYYGVWETSIMDVFHTVLKDCKVSETKRRRVVDAGANLGFFSLLSGVSGCRVDAFEVQDEVIDLHTTSIYLNNLHVDDPLAVERQQSHYALHHLAVSKAPGETLRYDPYFLYQKTNPGGVGIGTSGRRQVQTTSLDDFFLHGSEKDKLQEDENILLLKIDVEGHEGHVIEGAEKLLEKRRVDNLIVEIRLETSATVLWLQGVGYSARYIAEPTWFSGFFVNTEKVVDLPTTEEGLREFFGSLKTPRADVWFSLGNK
jgi:FkbM family methyltransferase